MFTNLKLIFLYTLALIEEKIEKIKKEIKSYK
jgi:hypothetical protein